MPTGDPGARPRWTIDRMKEADLADVISIERASFPSPWPRGAFLDELRSNPYARCVVLRLQPARGRGRPAGYICFWVLGEELLINNLAVDPRYRRQGVGRLLLDHAMAEALSGGCHVAYLEVRPSNLAAIALYESRGFRAIRRRKGYYSDTNEDALVMRATLKALETA